MESARLDLAGFGVKRNTATLSPQAPQIRRSLIGRSGRIREYILRHPEKINKYNIIRTCDLAKVRSPLNGLSDVLQFDIYRKNTFLQPRLFHGQFAQTLAFSIFLFSEFYWNSKDDTFLQADQGTHVREILVLTLSPASGSQRINNLPALGQHK